MHVIPFECFSYYFNVPLNQISLKSTEVIESVSSSGDEEMIEQISQFMKFLITVLLYIYILMEMNFYGLFCELLEKDSQNYKFILNKVNRYNRVIALNYYLGGF